MKRAYYLTNDLFFSSRVVGIAAQQGIELYVVNSQEKLTLNNDSLSIVVVVIDLSLPGLNITEAVANVKEKLPGVPLIAYGPHVHEELLQRAEAAGCDQVMSRGEFNQSIGRLFANNNT